MGKSNFFSSIICKILFGPQFMKQSQKGALLGHQKTWWARLGRCKWGNSEEVDFKMGYHPSVDSSNPFLWFHSM